MLKTLGWPSPGIDEEATGDKCYHVYADRRLTLNGRSILLLRRQMEEIAEANGGVFDGWDVTGLGLDRTPPGELRS